ncbi:TlpA disulfide reductase family protein [Actinomycetes bacterium KLBMP 9797]
MRALAAALLLLVTLAACGGEDRCPTSADGVLECAADQRSDPVQVAGELLAGGQYDVTADRGTVVVVNFWGSWCAPCRSEADDLEASYQATKGKGATFLGVNVRDGRDAAKAFEEGRVSYPSLYDPPGKVALDFDVPPNAIPATIVLDREGRIAAVIRRAVTQKELIPLVERIAAEKL